MAIDIKKFGIRVLPALFFVPVFIWVVKFLSVYYFLAFVMIVMLLGCKEFVNLAKKEKGDFYLIPSYIIMVAFACSAIWPFLSRGDILSLGFVIIMIYGLVMKTDVDCGLKSTALTLLGIFYLAMPLGYQLALKNIDGKGSNLLLSLYIIVWMGDSAAYLFGSTLGKHKLAPKVSPNKSIEGAVFNILFAVIGAFVCRHFLLPDISVMNASAIGLIVGFSGMLGDLVESLWKRCAGIKDSADLIPGHGGILDRLDSFVLSSPLMYIYYMNFM